MYNKELIWKLGEMDKELARRHYLKGRELWKKGLLVEAVQELEKTVAEDPNHSDATYSLGQLYLLTGDPVRALGIFETLSRSRPWVLNSICYAALIAHKIERYKDARKLYAQAIDLAIESGKKHISIAGSIKSILVFLYAMLGDLERKQGNSIKAFEYFYRLLTVEPEYMVSRYGAKKERVYEQAKKYKQSAEIVDVNVSKIETEELCQTIMNGARVQVQYSSAQENFVYETGGRLPPPHEQYGL